MFENNQSINLRGDGQAYVLRKPRPTKTTVNKSKKSVVEAPSIDALITGLFKIPLEEMSWFEWLALLRQTLKADHVSLEAGQVVSSAEYFYSGVNSASQSRQALNTAQFKPPNLNEVYDIADVLGSSWMLCSSSSDALKLLDVQYILGADVSNESGEIYPLRIMRSAKQGKYTDNDKKILSRLILPLQCAIRIVGRQERIQSMRQLEHDVIKHTGLGIIKLSADGSINEIDEQAKLILERNVGISLSPDSRALRFFDHQLEDEVGRIIKKAIAQCASGIDAGPIDIVALRQKDSAGYIYASVWSGLQNRPDCSVLVFIQLSNNKLPEYVKEMAKKMFGLSPKQAQLAMIMIEGHSLKQSALIEGNSINTMRSHRDEVLFKTGMNRQARLMRMMVKNLLLA